MTDFTQDQYVRAIKVFEREFGVQIRAELTSVKGKYVHSLSALKKGYYHWITTAWYDKRAKAMKRLYDKLTLEHCLIPRSQQ